MSSPLAHPPQSGAPVARVRDGKQKITVRSGRAGATKAIPVVVRTGLQVVIVRVSH